MRKVVAASVLGLVAAVSARAVDAQEAAAQACEGETYGTAVAWFRDIGQAARKARAEDRLVMVVHLAGELDDPGKT